MCEVTKYPQFLPLLACQPLVHSMLETVRSYWYQALFEDLYTQTSPPDLFCDLFVLGEYPLV